jgi:hypothetical protein
MSGRGDVIGEAVAGDEDKRHAVYSLRLAVSGRNRKPWAINPPARQARGHCAAS